MEEQGDRWGVHTSCDSQHSHDADNGGVDGQRSLLNLLQSDAHDGQQHDDQIQLVPPTHKHVLTKCCWKLNCDWLQELTEKDINFRAWCELKLKGLNFIQKSHKSDYFRLAKRYLALAIHSSYHKGHEPVKTCTLYCQSWYLFTLLK